MAAKLLWNNNYKNPAWLMYDTEQSVVVAEDVILLCHHKKDSCKEILYKTKGKRFFLHVIFDPTLADEYEELIAMDKFEARRWCKDHILDQKWEKFFIDQFQEA